jgi:hypothetical protein
LRRSDGGKNRWLERIVSRRTNSATANPVVPGVSGAPEKDPRFTNSAGNCPGWLAVAWVNGDGAAWDGALAVARHDHPAALTVSVEGLAEAYGFAAGFAAAAYSAFLEDVLATPAPAIGAVAAVPVGEALEGDELAVPAGGSSVASGTPPVPTGTMPLVPTGTMPLVPTGTMPVTWAMVGAVSCVTFVTVPSRTEVVRVAVREVRESDPLAVCPTARVVAFTTGITAPPVLPTAAMVDLVVEPMTPVATPALLVTVLAAVRRDALVPRTMWLLVESVLVRVRDTVRETLAGAVVAVAVTRCSVLVGVVSRRGAAGTACAICRGAGFEECVWTGPAGIGEGVEVVDVVVGRVGAAGVLRDGNAVPCVGPASVLATTPVVAVADCVTAVAGAFALESREVPPPLGAACAVAAVNSQRAAAMAKIAAA